MPFAYGIREYPLDQTRVLGRRTQEGIVNSLRIIRDSKDYLFEKEGEIAFPIIRRVPGGAEITFTAVVMKNIL